MLCDKAFSAFDAVLASASLSSMMAAATVITDCIRLISLFLRGILRFLRKQIKWLRLLFTLRGTGNETCHILDSIHVPFIAYLFEIGLMVNKAYTRCRIVLNVFFFGTQAMFQNAQECAKPLHAWRLVMIKSSSSIQGFSWLKVT
jgi:hypothetical protein